MRADVSIDQLVEQARLTEGDVSVRDLPRWHGAKKILIRDVGFDLAIAINAAPDVEFIAVTSLAEAMQHASDVDAIVGYCSSDLIDAADKLVWIQIYAA